MIIKNKFSVVIFSLLISTILISCNSNSDKTKTSGWAICNVASIPEIPDVTIITITQEQDYAPHCKVVGFIGKEIKFELLLPEEWNGKFVMGGGGGFVGSVVNTALSYGALQAGYATVGTDTGHEGHPLDASWDLTTWKEL